MGKFYKTNSCRGHQKFIYLATFSSLICHIIMNLIHQGLIQRIWNLSSKENSSCQEPEKSISYFLLSISQVVYLKLIISVNKYFSKDSLGMQYRHYRWKSKWKPSFQIRKFFILLSSPGGGFVLECSKAPAMVFTVFWWRKMGFWRFLS